MGGRAGWGGLSLHWQGTGVSPPNVKCMPHTLSSFLCPGPPVVQTMLSGSARLHLENLVTVGQCAM